MAFRVITSDGADRGFVLYTAKMHISRPVLQVPIPAHFRLTKMLPDHSQGVKKIHEMRIEIAGEASRIPRVEDLPAAAGDHGR
jgi:hypothetical protein